MSAFLAGDALGVLRPDPRIDTSVGDDRPGQPNHAGSGLENHLSTAG